MKTILNKLKEKGVQVGFNFSNGHTFGTIIDLLDNGVLLEYRIKEVIVNRFVPYDKIFLVEWEHSREEKA